MVDGGDIDKNIQRVHMFKNHVFLYTRECSENGKPFWYLQ